MYVCFFYYICPYPDDIKSGGKSIRFKIYPTYPSVTPYPLLPPIQPNRGPSSPFCLSVIPPTPNSRFCLVTTATTYHQITRFVQGYVDNEINLNPDESCKDTCSDYKQTRNYKCSTGTVCADDIAEKTSTKCNGTVLNCEFIEEDLTACPVIYWRILHPTPLLSLFFSVAYRSNLD